MEKPSMARMYDYYLGGTHHTPADRAAAERILAAVPALPVIARANRAFLGRAVRELVTLGVRQFLDVGSGIPTAGNVHEIAQGLAPESRVVYVDIDPEAVAHSNEILRGNEGAAAIQADLAVPAGVIGHPEVARLLDLDRPVALLLMSVLHFVPDEAAVPGVRQLRESLPAGSFLGLTHVAEEAVTRESKDTVDTAYGVTNAATTTPRTRAQILDLFGGWQLLDPGLVWAPLWRPDTGPDATGPDATGPAAIDPAAMPILAGVARKL
jgi:S-adenosyl methyltransferase